MTATSADLASAAARLNPLVSKQATPSVHPGSCPMMDEFECAVIDISGECFSARTLYIPFISMWYMLIIACVEFKCGPSSATFVFTFRGSSGLRPGAANDVNSEG